jgi:hypothetical protein
MATFMLSALIQQTSGVRLTEYLEPRLFEPLGIAQYVWHRNTDGFDTGGWGLEVTTDAIGRFGLLYLQGGVWEGRQLLSPGWVEQATAKQVENGPGDSDWNQGYGYQFWRCRHGAYRADGAFGQFCVIHPDLDLVVVTTAAMDDLGEGIQSIWDEILPAVSETESRVDGDAVRLTDKLSQLELPMPGISRFHGLEHGMGGQFELERTVNGFTDVNIAFGEMADSMVWSGPSTSERWVIGHQHWKRSVVDDRTIAATGAWIRENAYEVHVRMLENTFGENLLLEFDDSGLKISRSLRCSFSPADPAEIFARRVAR